MKPFNSCVDRINAACLRRIITVLCGGAALVLVLHLSASLRAADPAAPPKGNEPSLLFSWESPPGWHDSTETAFDYSGDSKPTVFKEKKLLDESIIYCGVGVGGKATSKDDQVFKTFFKGVTKGYMNGLDPKDVVKPVAMTLNKVEYQKLNTSGSGPNTAYEVLAGVENGRCVAYWFLDGPSSELKGFHSVVGKIKFEAPAAQK